MAAPAEPSPKRASSLTLRIISAAVLIPVAVAAIYFGGWFWKVLVWLFGTQMIVEWCRISYRPASGESTQQSSWASKRRALMQQLPIACVSISLIAFAAHSVWSVAWWMIFGLFFLYSAIYTAIHNPPVAPWFTIGMIYVVFPCTSIIWLREDPTVGVQQIAWIVALVIAADTGAYIAGRSIGGPKLAPRISPNKTWAGLGGAVVSAAIVGAITATVLARPNIMPLVAVSAALAIVEQAGDLAESAFKRHFGVKDASNIIPGHGGALDRVDGLIAVAAAVAGLNAWIGSSVLTWL
jgi:phosphatidate cytidylyltransferase